jgi:hypothetical protein
VILKKIPASTAVGRKKLHAVQMDRKENSCTGIQGNCAISFLIYDIYNSNMYGLRYICHIATLADKYKIIILSPQTNGNHFHKVLFIHTNQAELLLKVKRANVKLY